jgi:hypothetical protein
VRWFLPVVILQYIYTAVYGMSPPLSTRIPGPSISRRRGMDRNRLSGRPFIMLLHSYSFEFSALSEALFSCQTCRRLTVGRSVWGRVVSIVELPNRAASKLTSTSGACVSEPRATRGQQTDLDRTRVIE